MNFESVLYNKKTSKKADELLEMLSGYSELEVFSILSITNERFENRL